ncbi:MAG: hypothetical protein KGK08_01255 [Acidobacteriota bacterium]|nr:hypothetical protein [Acidobacteriota bacterium]
MRLPFPVRIPIPIAMAGAALLVAVQQVEGTPLEFSILTCIYILLACLAFNFAGGFSRPSGGYVFFYATLVVIVGLVLKAYLGEPADLHLQTPIRTMRAETAAMLAMLIAVLISKRLTTKKAILAPMLKEKDERNASVGAFVIGLILYMIMQVTTQSTGSVLTALAQLNRFLPLSVVLATLYAHRQTGGARTYNKLVFLTVGVSTLFGVFAIGKEGMFTPITCWVLASASTRCRLRWSELAVLGVFAALAIGYLVPYSQYGRSQVTPEMSIPQRIQMELGLLTHLQDLRRSYANESVEAYASGASVGYYNNPQGIGDRTTMLFIDDQLIHQTELTGTIGYTNLYLSVLNWVPHALWPTKPMPGGGNAYAHEIGGILPEEDDSTGISFSATSEAYHMGGWQGIFLAAPAVWIVLFTVFDSLCGDTRRSPWGLLIIAYFAHQAPEGMLGGAIYAIWYVSVGIIFTAAVTAYVLPIVGTLAVGAEKAGQVSHRRLLATRRAL